MGDSVYFLFATLLTNAMAQLLYKGFAVHRRPLMLLGALLAFLFVPYFSYEALKGLKIDVVYMAMAFTIVLVALGSLVFFAERLERKHYLGGALILIGILVYNL
jgi:multidrug transporter EmrE-like cation transporter